MSAKTSLARQLELLKLPQTSVHKEKHGSASFLYDFFEAKTIDADTHFSVALSGLENLIKIDPYIDIFKNTIFNESSKRFDRGVESKETNEKIDQIIEEFLFRVVSKYFQLSDTHKTLEWLIYRYNINDYNTDALIGSVLPYHETRLFVRLLQTCSTVKNPRNTRWYWLKNVQESGVPLAKTVLLNHCATSLEFVRFVTDSTFKSLQIDPENSIFASFLVSFCFNLLERSTNEVTVAMIISIVSKGLRMKNKHLYIASYMIFSHLCTMTKLEEQIIEKLLKSFIRKIKPETFEGALLAFNIIFKSNDLNALPSEFVSDEFVNNLVNYSNTYNFEPLIKAFLLTIIDLAIKEDTDNVLIETYKDFTRRLFEISNGITENLIKSVIISINNNIDTSTSSESNEYYSYVIRLTEKLFSSWFNSSLSELKSVAKISKLLNTLRYDFVKNADVLLFVGLDHQNEKIRRESMLHFAENFKHFSQFTNQIDLLYLKHVIQNKLLQDLKSVNPDIFLDIFRIKDKIFNLFTHQDFEKIACQILNYCDEVEDLLDPEVSNLSENNRADSQKWFELKKLILEIYCSQSFEDYVGNKNGELSLFEKMFIVKENDLKLINYLLPAKPNELIYATIILESNYAKSNHLVMKIASSTSVLKKMKKYISKPTSDYADFAVVQKSISSIIIDEIVGFFSKNMNLILSDSFYMKFVQFIQQSNFSNSKRTSMILVLVLAKIFVKCEHFEIAQPYSLGNIILDILLNQLTYLKLSSRSEVKVLNGLEFDNLDVSSIFVTDITSSNRSSISIFTVGYIVYSLIKPITNLPTGDMEMKNIFYVGYDKTPVNSFYSKLYYLLVHFSTPNETKPLQKKIFKLFRNLFALFLQNITTGLNSNFALNLILPYIANSDNVFIQIQTLSFMTNLLKLTTSSKILIESLENNSSYLISYLIALSSKNIHCRQLAVKNLKLIEKELSSESLIKKFISGIVSNEDLIITSDKHISKILSQMNEEKNSVVIQLFSIIQTLLTDSNSSKVCIRYKISLLNLLCYASISIKTKIIEYYMEKFFPKSNRSDTSIKMFSDENELELQSLLSFYENELDAYNLFKVSDPEIFINFYIAILNASKQNLSQNLSLNVYNLLTKKRFESMCNVNQDAAIRVVACLLQVQLDLSENGNNLVSNSNGLTLINSIRTRLRKITFNGTFILHLLNHLLPIEEIYDTYAYCKKDVSSEKRIRMDETNKQKFCTGWKLLRIYVGIFQNKENLEDTNHLVKTLFDYLKLTFMEVDDNSNEYTRQTILYAIVNCTEMKLMKRSSTLNQRLSKKTEEIDNEEHSKDMEEMDIDYENRQQISLTEYLNNMNVDVIIDCMRESRLKETQKVSLLLIGLIAPYFQRQIIEYLVSIFTFIGTSLIQCDDQYSSDILFETMESIIPIILENDKPENLKLFKIKDKDFGESDLKEYIISIFDKSFNHIPSYRRLALFTKLIQLLGQDRFLSVLTVRLLEQVCLFKSKTLRTEKEVWLSFLSALFGNFSPLTQLTALCILLNLFERKFLHNNLKRKALQKQLIEYHSNDLMEEDDSKIDLISLKNLSASICKDFKSKIIYDSDKLACGVEILKFIVSLISSPEFIESVHSCHSENASTLLIYFLNILLELIVSLNPGDSSMGQSLNVYRKRIKSALDELLLKYNALLPHDKLIEIVTVDLLNNTIELNSSVSILIKRKALELLNEKLIKLGPNDLKKNIPKKIIKTLEKHLPNEYEDIRKMDDVQIHNVQLMMLSLKLSTKFLEMKVQDETQSHKIVKSLSNVLIRIVNLVNSIVIDSSLPITSRTKLMQNLKGSSVLCITQVLCTLSLEGIQFLSNVVEIILNNFNNQDDIIIISNVSALSKIISKFAQFLSPHLKSIILKLLSAFKLCDKIGNLESKLKNTWTNLASLIPKRVLFEAIDSSYEEASSTCPLSIINLMSLFKMSCDNIEKTDVEIIVKSFKNFMIKALGYRSKYHSSVELHLIERIESSFGEAFSAFIPKLTETVFRPIFYRLLEWAIQVEDHKIFNEDEKCYSLTDQRYHRMIAFYRFCSLLADRLKSLFCVFVAPSILNNCSEMLMAYHSVNFTNEDSENDDNIQIDSRQASETNCRLLLKEPSIGEPLVSAILSTLSKCFLYDLNGAFVNKDCTSLIIKPIVNQITNLFGTVENYNTRLELILQCTQYLIQNNKDETLIKDFNYQILLKTRESSEKVRVGAIKVLHRLILTCSEDYLPFIPEAIPFIAELSEDDSEQVESDLKKLIIDIEQLVGEPINKYL